MAQKGIFFQYGKQGSYEENVKSNEGSLCRTRNKIFEKLTKQN